MAQHEPEVETAKQRIGALGLDPADFSFDVEYEPPDPDGAGMFTVRYVVTITRGKTGKSLGTIGGIGFDWVGDLEEELRSGYFD